MITIIPRVFHIELENKLKADVALAWTSSFIYLLEYFPRIRLAKFISDVNDWILMLSASPTRFLTKKVGHFCFVFSNEKTLAFMWGIIFFCTMDGFFRTLAQVMLKFCIFALLGLNTDYAPVIIIILKLWLRMAPYLLWQQHNYVNLACCFYNSHFFLHASLTALVCIVKLSSVIQG